MTEDNKLLLKSIERFVSSLELAQYNLADMLVSPLYLESLKIQNRESFSQRLLNRLKKNLYNLKEIFQRAIQASVIEGNFEIVFCPSTLADLKQLYPIAKKFKESRIDCVWVTNKRYLAKALIAGEERCYLLKPIYVSDLVFRKGDYSLLLEQLDKFEAPEVIKNVWRRVFRENLVPLTGLIRSFELIIERLNPKCLIVANDLTVEGRAATHVFKLKSIYTVSVQHGEMSGMLDSKHLVDEFFVYGAHVRAMLEKGNPNVKFTVSGAPYLDSVNMNEELYLRKDTPLEISDSYILVAFSGPGNNTSFKQHKLFVKSIYNLAIDNPDQLIVVKLHPKDKLEFYEEIGLTRVGNVKFVSKNSAQDIFYWLRSCCFLITGASMTAIEAMSLRIPVITMDYFNEYNQIDFINKNVTIKATSDAELKEAAQLLIKNKLHYSEIMSAASLYAQTYFYRHQDRSSSSFIVEEILSNIDKKI